MNILALDIGGTAIKAALIGEHHEILDKREYETNAKNGGQYVMKRALEIAHEFSGFDRIGISTTGQVDSRNGIIVYVGENVPNYSGTDVRGIFMKEFGMPVAVENDVNCAAIGETHYGCGKPYRDLLCVTYGTGIGGAILIDNRLYGGAKGLAGEFGHLVTHPDGRLCNCGQYGCYEQYAATTALVRNAKEYRSDLTSGRIIFEEWAKGDEHIKEIIDNWVDEIVFGLVTLIHIFNPNALILGGGILAEKYIEDEINRKIYSKVMKSYSDFAITRAQLGNNAGLLGAYHIVKHGYGY